MLRMWLALTVMMGAGWVAAQTVPALPPGRAAAAQNDAMTRGRSLALGFYALQVSPLWSAFTPEMQAEWGSLEQFTAYRQAGLTEYGQESRVISERVIQRDGLNVYIRTAVFARHPQEAWAVVMGFDASGHVALFTIMLAGDLPDDARQV